MCDSCNAVYVQAGWMRGIVHEHGCPDAWKDSVRECKWCGTEFKPEYKEQKCCSDECQEAYYG